MISDNQINAVIAILLMIGFLIWWWWFGRWLERRLAENTPEPDFRDLADLQTRDGLSSFLRKNNICGSAEIRDGQVFQPVPLEKLHPLIAVLDQAAFLLGRMPNMAADVLYVRNRDGSYALTGIDLSDIREAATLLRQVAEERQKEKQTMKKASFKETRYD